MTDENNKDEGCCCIGSRMKKGFSCCGMGGAQKKREERPEED